MDEPTSALLDPRSLHASQLIRAASLLAAVGVAAVIVDQLVAKAFKYARTAMEDEARFGSGSPRG